MRVIIIGGGASGMMAAITAAQNPAHSVLILERQARVGRKLAATGNGRCNLSNLHLEQGDYQTDAPEILGVMQQFTVSDTLLFFQDLGLVTTAEPDGKLYPYSNQANSVIDVLRFALDRPNIQIISGAEVTGAHCSRDGIFTVRTVGQKYDSDALILAAGGPAGGKLGGTADAAQLAKRFGHHIVPMLPGLVQLKCSSPALRSLKGVRAEAALTLLHHRRSIQCLTGEVQFTDYGLSGPAIFTLSRAAASLQDAAIQLDLLPQYPEAELTAWLKHRVQSAPQLTAENLLTGMLHNRLGRTLVLEAGLRLDRPLATLAPDACRSVAHLVKTWTLSIDGSLGFDQAQVTIGGIRAAEFDPQTLESRLCPKLYACGEALNVDGPCGGFNLQWAWSSGHVAGLLGHTEETT